MSFREDLFSAAQWRDTWIPRPRVGYLRLVVSEYWGFVALPEDWKEQQVVIMLGRSGRPLEGMLLEVNNTGVAVSVPDPEDFTEDTVFYPWHQIHWITPKTD
jgi:hypothetical protein